MASEVGKTDFVWQGGATNYTNLNSDDADTSYSNWNDNAGYVECGLDDLDGQAATISGSATVYHKDRKITNNASIAVKLKYNGTATTVDGGGETIDHLAYTGHSDSMALDPEGNAWSVVAVNGTSFYYDKTAIGGNTNGKMTYAYVEFVWLYSDQGTSWFLAEWLAPFLPLVGAAVSAKEIMQMSLRNRPGFNDNVKRPQWLSTRIDFDRARAFFERRPTWLQCRQETPGRLWLPA
jgi:hypothetical protein